jgi:hypothetical protein
MSRVIIIASGVEVELLHQGFDLVIVQFDNGLQQLFTPQEVGLKRRERPKGVKY